MFTALWDHALLPIQWSVVIGASLVAAWCDLRTHRIPNLLTGPLLLAGLIWAGWIAGVSGVLDGIAGFVLVSLPYVILFVVASRSGGKSKGGAGDAKMMGAIGAWLGLIGGAVALVCVAFTGAVVGLGYALARGHLSAALANIAVTSSSVANRMTRRGRDGPVLVSPPEQMQPMPYGPAISLGLCVAAALVGIWRWMG